MSRPVKRLETDVLVIGAGIAGVTAAIHAARAGARCILTSAGPLFSGASFFPGTWGFGLIALDGEEDIDELSATIAQVGMGMADPALTSVLVQNIHARVRELEGWGLSLLRPADKGQREFIPCFDHKNRDWYGLVQADTKQVLSAQLERYGVNGLAHTELLALRKERGAVCGALAATPDGFLEIGCRAVVIACGGMAGLHAHAFGAADCCGLGQLLALEAGARLVNVEFSQMMPGFVSPCPRTIYNEKVFRCSRFYGADGAELFDGLPPQTRERLLDARSGHGPFTSRLSTAAVDLRLFEAFLSDPRGVRLCYDEDILQNPPEFVQVYFEWLAREKHLTAQDEVRIGIFYHASNGGIRIGTQAETGVPGLYACGEATGGMHGADRLGGLSTANALVFGGIAGARAAAYAQDCDLPPVSEWCPTLPLWNDAAESRERLRRQSFPALTLRRDAKNLATTLRDAGTLFATPPTAQCDFSPEQARMAVESRRMQATARLTEAIAHAALLRAESRGSHYRPDFPQTDPALEQQILLRLDTEDSLCAAWQAPQR